mmetsp:Transcript_24592/g.70627  ORF Transcript_24592/g.70627 Transcript_24592/m.70627 type:complete len:324 (+) Transcript_24592:191-1162(+)
MEDPMRQGTPARGTSADFVDHPVATAQRGARHVAVVAREWLRRFLSRRLRRGLARPARAVLELRHRHGLARWRLCNTHLARGLQPLRQHAARLGQRAGHVGHSLLVRHQKSGLDKRRSLADGDGVVEPDADRQLRVVRYVRLADERRVPLLGVRGDRAGEAVQAPRSGARHVAQDDPRPQAQQRGLDAGDVLVAWPAFSNSESPVAVQDHHCAMRLDDGGHDGGPRPVLRWSPGAEQHDVPDLRPHLRRKAAEWLRRRTGRGRGVGGEAAGGHFRCARRGRHGGRKPCQLRRRRGNIGGAGASRCALCHGVGVSRGRRCRRGR